MVSWTGLPVYLDTFLIQSILISGIMYVLYNYTLSSNKMFQLKAFLVTSNKKIVEFFKNIIKAQVETIAVLPLIIFLLMVILSGNFIGMIPYTTTLTSQIIMTLSLSMIMFITINIMYVIKQKIQSSELFLPSGTPLFIMPFLIQIEVVSYLSRVVSLSLRLFANMTSGHTLIKILSGFGTALSSIGGIGAIISIIPIIIVFIVTGLELLIAGLQTYVFIILTLIYLHELESGH